MESSGSKFNTERFDGLTLGVTNFATPVMDQYYWEDPQTKITVFVEEAKKPEGNMDLPQLCRMRRGIIRFILRLTQITKQHCSDLEL